MALESKGDTEKALYSDGFWAPAALFQLSWAVRGSGNNIRVLRVNLGRGVTPIPGLKSTMARRHPSSDLSICMSFILETSSVRTLFTGSKGREGEKNEFQAKDQQNESHPYLR